MTDAGQSRSQPRSRLLSIALVASLAVNVLFIGGISSAAYHTWHGHKKWNRAGGDMGLMAFARTLPDERGDALRREFRSERKKLEPLKNDIRERWKQANEKLGSEPFDKSQFGTSVDDAVKAEMAFRAAVSATLVEMAAKLSPEDRKAFSAWRESQFAKFQEMRERRKSRRDSEED